MKTLKDYVKLYKSQLDQTICCQTVEELQNAKWDQHMFYHRIKDSVDTLSGTNELSISYENVSTVNTIMFTIQKTLIKYIDDVKSSCFDGGTGISTVRFNKYDTDKQMASHCDHIYNIFDGERRGIPILSIVGVLNDSYSGGDFIMFEEEKIDINSGDILIFPSVFLYPHKVDPVTAGTRFSYVAWAW